MLRTSSYDTTIGQAINHSKLEQSLRLALSNGLIDKRRLNILPIGDCSAVFVTGMDAEESQIPAFGHPFLVEHKGKKYLVSDVRSFKATTQLYPTDTDFEAAVKNKSEYALVKNRAALELRWIAGQQNSIRARLAFAGNVFGSWISQTVSRVYALDLNDQLLATAIAIYYYHTLFTASKKLEGQALEKAVIHTINATKLQAKEVYELFEKMPEMEDVAGLCAGLKVGLENIRLHDFNALLLLTQLGNSWYGNNAKEMIGVATEFPPAWIAIVFAAMTEKTYKNSPIYKLVEIQAKRTAGVYEFQRNFADLIEDVVAMESADNAIIFKDFE